MKVTALPAQMLLALAAIETEGLTVVFTTIVVLFEVAVTGDAQFEFEVNITVTTSLLARVVEVKVAEFVPAEFPLIFHA